MSLDKLGKDEWVSQIGERRRQQNPTLAAIIERWQQLPRLGQIVLIAAIPVALPLLVHNDYILRVVGLIWLYAALALGLNIVVGFAGLLDLGYVASFGGGAYVYAMLSSDLFGIHWPTVITLPLITLLLEGIAFVLVPPSVPLQDGYLVLVNASSER